MSFGNTVNYLISAGYKFRVRGFFNVEGGQMGLSNKFHEWCDCMSMRPGPAENCESCGRTPGNYVSIAAGDGDGIYVVAEIVDNSSKEEVVGAMVVFDNQYQLANQVRTAIEQETVPKFPLDLALSFAETRPLTLGPMVNTGTVLFADSGAGLNPRDAVVDVQIDTDKQLSMFGFVESVSTDPDEWVKRFDRAQGLDSEATYQSMVGGLAMGQHLFDSLGIDQQFSLPPIIPRVIMVLDDSVSAFVNLDDQYFVDDWKLLGAQTGGAVGSSHTQVMAASTVWMNALLAREWDRVAGDDLSYEETKQLLFESWTWAYQGAILDDDDCRRMIAVNRYRATPEEVANMLRRRGLVEAAEKALSGDLPAIGVLSSSSAVPMPAKVTSLTKTNSGLTKATSDEPAAFCVQCGIQFRDAAAKFCANCGSAR